MENISREHILRAIEEIDETGRKDRPSFKFELLYNGKSYPPLLVVAIANKKAGGDELPPNSSAGGWASEEFKVLKENNFRVVEKVNEKELNNVSYALSKFDDKKALVKFFQLLRELLDQLNLFTDDKRLSITYREGGRQRVSVNLNSRLVLSLHRQSSRNYISFMVSDEVADSNVKHWERDKYLFNGSDNLVSVDVPVSKVQSLSDVFIKDWKKQCFAYLSAQEVSQYRKHHNELLYRLAFDSTTLLGLQLDNKLVRNDAMNFQETISAYPVAVQFHDFLTQFHKTPATPREYVVYLNKVEGWFKDVGITDQSFNIWKDTDAIAEIQSRLDSDYKSEWKSLNTNNNNWYSAPWNKWVAFNKETSKDITSKPDSLFETEKFFDDVLSANLQLSEALVYRFSASLLAKRFLILTGLSGSGKTKLAQSFVRWISAEQSQYVILPVAADWTNREPLFGYPNALNPAEYVKPESGVLDLILRAEKQSDTPHFLILDEMNLSHVERYFADFLSGLESNEKIPLHKSNHITDVPQSVQLPKNLFVIGTVNIDETTYMFSPKVLDRANVIEFRVSQDEIGAFLESPKAPQLEHLDSKGAGMGSSFAAIAATKGLPVKNAEKLNEALLQFFAQLKLSGAEFGYRTAHEIHRLAGALYHLWEDYESWEVIDICIMQKLLPKVHGSRRKLEPILKDMVRLCVDTELVDVEDLLGKPYQQPQDDAVNYPMSLEKLHRMYRGAIENGFTSYAEA